MFSSTLCLEVYLSTAADTTLESEISGRRVSIAGWVHIGAAFTATVLGTSMVRSVTRLRSQALCSLIWSMVLFIFSTMMLDRVATFRLIVTFTFWVNMLCREANCAFIAGLFLSSTSSFMILNRVA